MTAHSHASHGPGGAQRTGRLLLAALLVPSFVATVLGLVLLWPGDTPRGESGIVPAEIVSGRVTEVREVPCGGREGSSCLSVTLRLAEGPDAGEVRSFELDPSAGQPRVSVGDRVRAGRSEDVTGSAVYAFDDFDRSRPLGLLLVITAVAIVAVARWRGLAALVGVGVTVIGLGVFVLPALLAGEDPLAVAIVGSSALLFVVLYLAHGVSARTSAALVGTLVSLAACAVLSVVATAATRLTGLSDETNIGLQGFARDVSLTEVLICGFVIGALGALNDVTITQASAVWEIAHSDPAAGARTLYARAMRIGRDHIASSVYTLVFAYAGTALPLLLVLSLLDRSPLDVASGDLLAVEIVRTAVGTLGLLVAVPVTTAVASLTAAGGGAVTGPRG